MTTPAPHRKWAREFLVRAERAQSHARKRRYLRLAVRNTVCAWKLEAEMSDGEAEANSLGAAEDSPPPKH
jgi:hypothetical protein